MRFEVVVTAQFVVAHVLQSGIRQRAGQPPGDEVRTGEEQPSAAALGQGAVEAVELLARAEFAALDFGEAVARPQRFPDEGVFADVSIGVVEVEHRQAGVTAGGLSEDLPDSGHVIDDHLRNLKSPLSAGLEHDHRNFQLFDEGPAALLQQRGAGEQQAVQPAEAVDSLLRSEPGFRRNGTDVTALPLEKISGLLPGYSQNLFHFGVAILLAVVQGAADEETAFLLTGMVDETAAALPPEDDAGRGKIVQGGVCGFERNFVLFCELRSGEKRRAVREFFPQNFRPDFFRHLPILDLPFHCRHRILRLPPHLRGGALCRLL